MANKSNVNEKYDNLIEFNCLGNIYSIRQSSLDRFPNTLIGDSERRASFYNKTKHQYIIDRHVTSFEAILNYYETGTLNVPTIYEPTIFLSELLYFQIDNKTIENFCKTEIPNEFIKDHRIVPFNLILRFIWLSLEYSDYSIFTKIIQLICLFISLIFCLNISIELYPEISRDQIICYKSFINQNSNNCDNIFFDFRPPKLIAQRIYRAEQICTIFLCCEYILRLISSPHRWITFLSPINLIDLFLLFIQSIYFTLIHTNISSRSERHFIFYVRIFQHLTILRLFRFFRLCRYVRTLRILFYGVIKSFKDVLSIGFIILFFVLTFGVVIQVIEKNWDHSHVTRLEDLFNIVTISTITVGDAKRVPLSPSGKILCSILAGIGLIGISLPTPSIYRGFQTIYQIENMNKRLFIVKYIYPNGKIFSKH